MVTWSLHSQRLVVARIASRRVANRRLFRRIVRAHHAHHVRHAQLCANLGEGGTTPSYGTIECVAKALRDHEDSMTRLHVLVRGPPTETEHAIIRDKTPTSARIL